jgi:hypothetical protein
VTAIIAKGKSSFAEESGHWYTRDGKPAYTIIGANGKERNTTLADARKLGLVPSVSTIMQIEAKPQLIKWLVQQGMMACMTLPRNPGENDTDFMERALEDSKQQTRKAAERGSYLHGLMEQAMRGDVIKPEDLQMYFDYIQPVQACINDEFPGYTWAVERSAAATLGYGVAPTLGYGGKLDLTGTHPTLPPVVIDYKCKDFKPENKKKLAYVEHVTQLAAYADMLYGPTGVRCLNIFISSTVPGLFEVKEWTQAEITQGRLAFGAMLNLWQIRKEFV